MGEESEYPLVEDAGYAKKLAEDEYAGEVADNEYTGELEEDVDSA